MKQASHILSFVAVAYFSVCAAATLLCPAQLHGRQVSHQPVQKRGTRSVRSRQLRRLMAPDEEGPLSSDQARERLWRQQASFNEFERKTFLRNITRGRRKPALTSQRSQWSGDMTHQPQSATAVMETKAASTGRLSGGQALALERTRSRFGAALLQGQFLDVQTGRGGGARPGEGVRARPKGGEQTPRAPLDLSRSDALSQPLVWPEEQGDERQVKGDTSPERKRRSITDSCNLNRLKLDLDNDGYEPY